MADEEHLEQQQAELDSITQIAGSDYVVVESDEEDPKAPISYKIRVVPRGGGDLNTREQRDIMKIAREEDLTKSIAMDNTNGDYSSVWMHVRYPPEYPDVDPEITLEKIRGVSNDEFRELQHIVDENKSVEASSYDVVIYGVWDALRTYLLEHNGNDEIQLARRQKREAQLNNNNNNNNDDDDDDLVVVPGMKVNMSDFSSDTSSSGTSSISPSDFSSSSMLSSSSSVQPIVDFKKGGNSRWAKKIKVKKGKTVFKAAQLKMSMHMQQQSGSTTGSPTSSCIRVSPSTSPTFTQQLVPTFKGYEKVKVINDDTYSVKKHGFYSHHIKNYDY